MKTTLVLLPAAFTEPEDFVSAGFVTAVEERRLPLDLQLAQLRLEHITDRTIVERLRRDVIEPARAEGRESIWICGVSIGAFVALSYAERHRETVDGLCLLAPYLGSHITIDEIERAGGLGSWRAGPLDDDERRVWRFIQGYSEHPLPIYVGLGSEDRFARGQRILAAALPRECVDIVPGAHDWALWRRLWDNFLNGWHTSP